MRGDGQSAFDRDWDSGREEPRRREWLDKADAVTDIGRQAHEDVETVTVQLATEPLTHLNGDEMEGFTRQLSAMAHRLMHAAVIPYPNPIRVPVPG